MTYFQFLFLFLVPVLIFLIVANTLNSRIGLRELIGSFILVIIAILYTTPWDAYLINENIWYYDNSKVLMQFFNIPIEEYLFMLMQTLSGCLICCLIDDSSNKSLLRFQLKYVYLFLLLFLFGWLLIYIDSFKYLGLIIIWGSLPLGIQWSLGSHIILKNYKKYLLPFALITFYLWIADSIAIRDGIWTLSENTICRIKLYNLPIEEMIFFLITNLLVFQGMLLWKNIEFKND